jgi:signal recognition particle receptor subunit beta
MSVIYIDIPGGYTHSELIKLCHREVPDGLVILFDTNDPTSFSQAQSYIQLIDDEYTSHSLLLVGNKIDEDRNVSLVDSILTAWTHHCKYIECSILSDWNIASIFDTILNKILHLDNDTNLIDSLQQYSLKHTLIDIKFTFN